GYEANATIGRAIRLALLNIGGAIPGVGDMATMGHPGKYGYVIAENEASNPWEPLHVERGFPIAATTVTVIGSEGPHNINDHHSTTASGVLTMVSGGVATATANNLWYAGEAVIALCPEHAATIASSGFSKLDVKRFIYQNATVPLRKFSPENVERRYRQKFPERYAHAPLETPVHMTQCPEDFIVIVLGGAGKHSMFLPSFGETRSITRALKRRDGSLASSIEDLRRA
ncbi:MAG: UGSC family (seleno)protein, partial [Phycisphaerales bacterium]|nr:UGSC family (seleno)protein [Phycisphaerales bacterium]